MRELVDSTIVAALAEAVTLCENKQFLYFPNTQERYTYAQADEEIQNIAKGYMALGVKPGETVALQALNSSGWCFSFLALARIGAVVVSVNTGFKGQELAYVLKDSEAVLLVTAPSSSHLNYLEQLHQILPGLQESVPGQLESEEFPCLRGVVCTENVNMDGIVSRNSLLQAGQKIKKTELQSREEAVRPGDYCNMQYTSGTTGNPKGVQATHFAVLNNALDVSRQLQLQQMDIVCSALPLFYCFAFVAVLCATIVSRSALVLPAVFDADRLLHEMQQEKATYLCAVPTMLIELLHIHHLLKPKLVLDRVLVGGSLCPESVIKKAKKKLGVRHVYHGYGLTEGTCCVTMTHSDTPLPQRSESVGIPHPGVEIRIADAATRQAVPTGGQGNICIRGYLVMDGYFNNPEANEAGFDNEGWMDTGDVGYLDEAGYLYITGRNKELINRGGEKIYPKEIEHFLMRNESIQDVQVIGVPSDKYGEEVMACIILREGKKMKAEEVRQLVSENFAYYKVPKYVHFVSSFPLTASGKVQKHKLRDRVLQNHRWHEELVT